MFMHSADHSVYFLFFCKCIYSSVCCEYLKISTISDYIHFMHRPDEIVECLFSRKYEFRDAHIYVKIGIHAGCLFSQRDAHIHRELGHPDAHIHVNMGMGVRIFT